METKLARISQLSKENPDMVFTPLGHMLNKVMLKSCHAQMDGTKAVGIDGITKEEYGRSLEENINALQKKSYNWVEFLNMLDNSYPPVRPRIYVNIYE